MTTSGGTQSLEAWQLVRQMLDDMVAMVQEDAETELELLEGLRVSAASRRCARSCRSTSTTPRRGSSA